METVSYFMLIVQRLWVPTAARFEQLLHLLLPGHVTELLQVEVELLLRLLLLVEA